MYTSPASRTRRGDRSQKWFLSEPILLLISALLISAGLIIFCVQHARKKWTWWVCHAVCVWHLLFIVALIFQSSCHPEKNVYNWKQRVCVLCRFPFAAKKNVGFAPVHPWHAIFFTIPFTAGTYPAGFSFLIYVAFLGSQTLGCTPPRTIPINMPYYIFIDFLLTHAERFLPRGRHRLGWIPPPRTRPINMPHYIFHRFFVYSRRAHSFTRNVLHCVWYSSINRSFFYSEKSRCSNKVLSMDGYRSRAGGHPSLG